MPEITMVRFDGDNLQTVRDGERVWVVLKRACEALGIAEQGQAVKLKERPWAVTTMIVATGSDAKNYEMFCVDLETLPMWLATIDVNRVKPEAREKLIAYQRECARVLRDHFFGSSATTDLRAVAAVVAEAIGPLASTVAGLVRAVTELQQRVRFVEDNATLGSAISPARLRLLRSEVRSIAALEVANRRWKANRAASADIYRDMSEVVEWGGKGKGWDTLPSHLEQPAFAVLRRRRADAERALGRGRQLELISITRTASA